MTIDEESAWRAVLLARRAWQASPDRQSVVAPMPDGRVLRLDADGHFEATGPIDDAASALLTLFLPLLTMPKLVIGQIGQSLDGRIATRTGHSHYITGPAGLRHLHRLRAIVDAVVVGAGTIAADDPQLTVRHCTGDNPARVVIDRTRRLSSGHRVFAEPAAPSYVVCAGNGADAPPVGHAVAIGLPDAPGGFAPRAILEALAARGFTRVLIEGGGDTISRFLAACAFDALHVVVAPMIIGSGRAAITLPAIDRLDDALRARVRHHPLGDDMLFDLRLS